MIIIYREEEYKMKFYIYKNTKTQLNLFRVSGGFPLIKILTTNEFYKLSYISLGKVEVRSATHRLYGEGIRTRMFSAKKSAFLSKIGNKRVSVVKEIVN